MLAGPTCTLRVRRSGYVDLLRSYKILINGTRVGKIARNSVLDLNVPSGPITIEARIDWARSRPLMIVATPNQKIEIEVSNRWGADLWALTFGFRSYLTLEQVPSS